MPIKFDFICDLLTFRFVMQYSFKDSFSIIHELAQISKEVETLLIKDNYDSSRFRSLTNRIAYLRELLTTVYYSHQNIVDSKKSVISS